MICFLEVPSEVDGTKIPPFVTCSPHGGITSQILADMLKWIDTYYLQRAPSSPTPCLILDGHSYRFELPLLSYVTHSEHKWYPLIGIPYGTSIWQVGDSVEQNGCFKMHQYDYKNSVLNKKRELNLKDTNLKKQMRFQLLTTVGRNPSQNWRLIGKLLLREDGIPWTIMYRIILRWNRTSQLPQKQ